MIETYFTAPDNNTEVTDTKCSGGGNGTAEQPPTTTCPPRRPCPCNCDLVSPFLRDPATEEDALTVEERTEQIVSALRVNKKNTTLSRMRYTSASDNRTSAVGIGAVAALIIFSIIGVIVLIDLSRMTHDIKNGVRGLMIALGLQGIHSASTLQTSQVKATRDSLAKTSTTEKSTALSSISETPLTITETGWDDMSGINVPPASTSLS